MSFDGPVISLENIGKTYLIYERPSDRLRQFVFPRLTKLLRKREHNKYYREFEALTGVSFHVNRGETVGIVGRNGSGKSTLLQIVCGIIQPTHGKVALNGRVAALLELGAGFDPEFTGRENVHLNAAVLGLSKLQLADRFEGIVKFSGIEKFLDQPVKTYSSGMVVRLAFSIAINTDPDVLVVDEALAVGDEVFQRKCFSRIEELRRNGTTILFVSHSASTIVELCDRAILMDGGQMLMDGTPKDVVASYHKLAFASPDTQIELRSSLLARQRGERREASVSDGSSDGVALIFERSIDDEMETYDPGLESSSLLEYQSHGALITAPRILSTRSGKQVNHLIRGREYEYCYDVQFQSDALAVNFGMLLKTTSGFELGGSRAFSSAYEEMPAVASGARLEIRFKFSCHLSSGVYFANAGVQGLVDGSETYLHRLVDAVVFHVVPETQPTITGIVDFQCSSEIKKVR